MMSSNPFVDADESISELRSGMSLLSRQLEIMGP
jgi:hypothetical protein